MMKRYEVLVMLKGLEETKIQLELLSQDLENMYSESVAANFSVRTTAYKMLYKGDEIILNKKRTLDFINEEIRLVEAEINSLVTKYLYKGTK